MVILISGLLMLLSVSVRSVQTNQGSHVQYSATNFTCRNGVVVQSNAKCDGWNDCGNWDDECDCQDAPPTLCQYQNCVILDEQIRRRQMCDGVFDCLDLSDECLCDRRTNENQHTYSLCQSLLSYQSDYCKIGNLLCHDVETMRQICVPSSQLCDGKKNCANGIDEKYCGFLQNGSQKRISPLNNNSITAHKQNHVCSFDGKRNYYNQSKEICCSEQFKCGQDELWKGTFSNNCSAKEDNTHVFDWRRTFDGVPDCPDFSDEWHTHFVYCSPNTKVTDAMQSRCHKEGGRITESPQYVFKSRIFPVFEWIIATVTMISNGSLIYITLKSLLLGKKRMAWRAKRSHQIMILSLSTSDFLLGVQIVFNATSDAVMSGAYWKYENDWKSSGFCLLIGSIASLLTQAGVLTIVLIAAMRLSSVLRPFKQIRLKLVIMAAMSAWFFSSLIMSLSLVTFIPEMEKYFTSSVGLPTLPQVDQTVLERNTLEVLMTKTSYLYDILYRYNIRNYNFENMGWREMEQRLSDINHNFSGWKYFGLYSHSSTCFPPIVVTTKDHAWRFTVTALCADFFAYIFVIVSYAIVCKKTVHTQTPKNIPTKGEQQKRSRKRDKIRMKRQKEDAKIQKRIFLIVATDCVCWIPMCVLTFVNVAFPESGIKTLFSLSVCFILVQINSMINPFLYSKAHKKFLKNIWVKIFCFLRKKEENNREKSSKMDSEYSTTTPENVLASASYLSRNLQSPRKRNMK